MTEKLKVWMLHDNREGYAVYISRKDDIDLCILPYTTRFRANRIARAYMGIGYAFKGVLREGDLE